MMNELPDIQTVSKSGSRVEVSWQLSGSLFADWGDAALINRIGTAANQTGASHLAQKKGLMASSQRLHMTQFRPLEGCHLTAIAKHHFSDADGSYWRADVFCRSKDASADTPGLVAELTQTFRYVDSDQQSDRPLERRADADASAQSESVDGISASLMGKMEGVADRRRLQIFEGACEVISKKGWANASIRDITRAAKISIPTMYQYITSKEDILYLVTSICMEEILEHFQKRVDDDKPPIESLTDAVMDYFQYIDKNRRYINLLYSETRSLSEANRERIFHLEKKFIKLWEAILIKGRQSGVFDVANTDLAANLVYFLCTSWALRYWSLGRYPEDQVRDHILQMVLHGLSVADRPSAD